MSSGGYDDMGPRIDLGQGPEDAPSGAPQTGAPRTPPRTISPPPNSGGVSAVGLVALLLVIPALLLGMWNFFYSPEPPPLPPISSDAVPGATAERVAKLEKDVSSLILRMVTIEKEIQAMGSKAGSVTKLAELSNKVAALQDRIESLTLDKKLKSLERGRTSSPPPSRPAAKAKAKPKPKAETKPAPTIAPGKKPAAKAPLRPPKKRAATSKTTTEKLVYVVKRGDTLFTIAQRYKVRTSDLRRWNRMKKSDTLKAGKRLTIYITK